uniref:Rho-GAP domain-containing protein n=2 Tax=Lotharella globosa TaxID=91324 RepID=A0A7S3YP12_9EUKA
MSSKKIQSGHPRRHMRSPSMVQKICWQYKQGSDAWQNFWPQANADIERAANEQKDHIVFDHKTRSYIIDLKNQTGSIKGFKKSGFSIRRAGSHAMSEHTKSALEKLKKEGSIAVKEFSPPHHLVYKLNSVTGHLAPVFVPRANIGIAGRLVVSAIRGRGLHDTQSMGNQSPYIRFSTEATSSKKKAVYAVPKCPEGGTNPVWNHTLEIPLSCEDQFLRISVWNKNLMADSLIGRSRLPLTSIIPFLNPIIGFWHEDDAEEERQRGTPYDKLFLASRDYALECGSFTMRSWFEIVRDFKSTTQAGQILIEFRFFPYRASKIIEWDDVSDQKKVGEIRRAPKIFGETLQVGVASSEVKLPQPVFDCVEFLAHTSLDVEGVFRVPGDTKKVEEMKKMYDQRKDVTLKTTNEVAGLLKLYFRELKDPLIPYSLRKPIISVPEQAKGKEDMVEKFRVVIATMDFLSRSVLHYLIDFLSELAAHSDKNKMLPKNLAVCWAPTLMRPKNDKDESAMMDIPKAITTLEKLIEYRDLVFGEPKAMEGPKIFHKAQGSMRLDITQDMFTPPRPPMRASLLDEIKEMGSADGRMLRSSRSQRSNMSSQVGSPPSASSASLIIDNLKQSDPNLQSFQLSMMTSSRRSRSPCRKASHRGGRRTPPARSPVSREKSDMLADELKNSITADTIPEVSQASTSSQPPEVVSPPQSKRSPVLPSRKDPLAKLKAKLKTQSRSRSRSPPPTNEQLPRVKIGFKVKLKQTGLNLSGAGKPTKRDPKRPPPVPSWAARSKAKSKNREGVRPTPLDKSEVKE